MKILLKCVKKSFNIIKWLKKSLPSSLLDDSEELVRRCPKKFIRNNGQINKNAFYFGYPTVSVDRSNYKPYKKTLQDIPKNHSIDSWFLIGGIVEKIRLSKGVKEVKADPIENNPAHALIICNSKREKRNEIADSLSNVFYKIPEKKYIS